MWAWAMEKSGLFTVRSAYMHEMQTKLPLTETVGSSSRESSMWKALWKINVLPKFRVFWWRVLKDFLPSYGELQRTLHHAPEFPTVVCWEKVTIADPRLAMKVSKRLWVGKILYGDTLSVGNDKTYTIELSVGNSLMAHGPSVGK